MIADELAAALRDQDEAAEAACPREKEFAQLYEALGDRARQDEIRAANAETRHCRYLIADPGACEAFPADEGTARRGDFCPNNPYFTHRELFERLRRRAILLRQAEYLADLAELHLLPGAHELDPADFQMARIMRQHRKLKDMQLQTAVNPFIGGGGGNNRA